MTNRFKVHFLHILPNGKEEKKAKEVVADTPDQARSTAAKEFRSTHPLPHKMVPLKCKLVREARV